jgi:hypothetical protein
LRYVPEYEKRWARYARGGWRLLAVGRNGHFHTGDDLSLIQLWKGALSYVETDDRELTTQPSRLSTINAPELSKRGSISHRDEEQHKTIASGQYPDISLEQARARHRAARWTTSSSPEISVKSDEIR